MAIKHTYFTGPWHYCVRCDEKTKLDDMTWQRGLLLCPQCVDEKLVGDRELEIARVLNDGKVELDIHPKLKHPDATVDFDDGEISF